MHRASMNDPESTKLSKQPTAFLVYHVFWILNCVEVLYLIHLWLNQPSIFFLLIIMFNIVSMGASLVYADFYHKKYGHLVTTKIILGIFAFISIFCCIIVYTMELQDLLNYSQLAAGEAQQSLVNILLFTVPVAHCAMLVYITALRIMLAPRRTESESAAQNKLDPRNNYSRQFDDVETGISNRS
ncbi:unnamed protein product [Moneuplotes crassus]|uniref:Uncharacterized protein n=1 Tax=Euplotes crassus TaxID=5936 RepID=A0AAD2D6W9_EUPCR|nr:unnamed protein product [Moneuplotes crassus]